MFNFASDDSMLQSYDQEPPFTSSATQQDPYGVPTLTSEEADSLLDTTDEIMGMVCSSI